jgi:dienelactone hydrolase
MHYRPSTVAAAAALLLTSLGAGAEIIVEEVDYLDGDVALRGYLVWDGATDEKRPGVLVAHEWWGLNDYMLERSKMLAELGYVAFAGDLYGKEKVTEHGEQAGEWMNQMIANVEGWTSRAALGVDILRDHPLVDAEHLAAIGYCFGGATVMQLAYAGADLNGVVSFHGALPPVGVGQDENIKTSILAAHGAADSFVPAERVDEFAASLERAGADWQLVSYAGAKHGFTNPNVASFGMEALQYDAKADRRSWQLMQSFLSEVFGEES